MTKPAERGPGIKPLLDLGGPVDVRSCACGDCFDACVLHCGAAVERCQDRMFLLFKPFVVKGVVVPMNSEIHFFLLREPNAFSTFSRFWRGILGVTCFAAEDIRFRFLTAIRKSSTAKFNSKSDKYGCRPSFNFEGGVSRISSGVTVGLAGPSKATTCAHSNRAISTARPSLGALHCGSSLRNCSSRFPRSRSVYESDG